MSQLADPTEGREAGMEREQLQGEVGRAIATVPEKYRLALVLRDIEGLAYEEIAEVLGVPGGTVRSRINRARSMLKRKLQPLLAQAGESMSRCHRVRELFGAYWDDEMTRAEREWVDAPLRDVPGVPRRVRRARAHAHRARGAAARSRPRRTSSSARSPRPA